MWTRQDSLRSTEEDLESEKESLEYAKKSADLVQQLYDEIGLMIKEQDDAIAYWQRSLEEDIIRLDCLKKQREEYKQDLIEEKEQMRNDIGKFSESVIEKEKKTISSIEEGIKSSKTCIKSTKAAIKADQRIIKRHSKYRQSLIEWRTEVSDHIRTSQECVSLSEESIRRYSQRIDRLKNEIYTENLREHRP